MRSFVGAVEAALPSKKVDIFGKQGLLMNSAPYYILPIILLLGTQVAWNNAWVLMVIIYAVLPFVD